MDNEHEVDPADFTWPTPTKVARVREVTFTDAETGEEVTLEPGERYARTEETITVAWDDKGVFRLEP